MYLHEYVLHLNLFICRIWVWQ